MAVVTPDIAELFEEAYERAGGRRFCGSPMVSSIMKGVMGREGISG